MIATEQWVVTVYIDERDDRTQAEARLMKRDEPELRGSGVAHRNPRDVNVPEIGAELAASRALSQLADQLLDVSAADVERSTGQPAHFHS